MNYLRKFGMEYNPFLKSKDIKIELSEYKQLLFRLKHLEEIKGIGIITGEPGLGKTTAIRYWTNTLNKTMFKVIYIPHSTLTVMEFYRLLCDEFSLEVNYSKRKNFKSIQDEIKRLVIEKRITPVIILDEANYLPSSILNDLKICEEKYLSNLTKNMKKDDIDMFIRLYQEIGNNIINRKEDIDE